MHNLPTSHATACLPFTSGLSCLCGTCVCTTLLFLLVVFFKIGLRHLFNQHFSEIEGLSISEK